MSNLDFWTAENFYNRLDTLLKKQGRSFNSLSLDTESSAASLYEMRRKSFLPRFKNLCSICDALGISLYEFFFLEDGLSTEAYYVVTNLKNISEQGQKIIIELIKLLEKSE